MEALFYMMISFVSAAIFVLALYRINGSVSSPKSMHTIRVYALIIVIISAIVGLIQEIMK